MTTAGMLRRQLESIRDNTPILLETVGGYVQVDYRYQNGIHKSMNRDCSLDQMINGEDVNAVVIIGLAGKEPPPA